MSAVRNLLLGGAQRLPGDAARRGAELLLAHVLGQSPAWLVAHAEDAVDAGSAAAFQALIERRVRGEPIAYLVGVRGFHAIDLTVTASVLIPREDTEVLVEQALQRIPPDREVAVADLGTGSGAIALAIARQRPRARIVATDISAAALEVARGNAIRLAAGNVEFRQGSWCAALGAARFSVIVANPPYVAVGDPCLQEGDLRFEPLLALAAGDDGLDAIRVIVGSAGACLVTGGWLLIEHGFEQAAAVRGLLVAAGYRAVFTARDLEGRERVTGGGRA